MALGRESISGHWCYLCKLIRTMFSDLEKVGEIWNMEELLRAGVNGGVPKMGVKTKQWSSFNNLRV